MVEHRPTLFAISTGRPPAAIAVMRISGPAAFDAVRVLAGSLPPKREARLRLLRHPQSGDPLDQALVLLFPGPATATGEDLAELHLHGGAAVIAAVAAALAELPGLRPAEAGEFTRRAFENQVLDLAQVEGLADLLAAQTERQRRQAIAHLNGFLGQKAEQWRERMLDALALVEAELDFSDEGDVGESNAAVDTITAELIDALNAALAKPSAERLSEGLKVAVVGPPNAGKSSLINYLAGREVAIVTPIAGTTRDRIEVQLDISGLPFTLIDTAGLRETEDPVEAEGVARACRAAAEADIVIVMHGDADDQSASNSWGREDAAVLHVHSLCDVDGRVPGYDDGHVLHLSSHTGRGVDQLAAALTEMAEQRVGNGELLVLANMRQRTALEGALASLEDATVEADEILKAEHLRRALNQIGQLTGRVGVEDMLDALFGRFCIGK